MTEESNSSESNEQLGNMVSEALNRKERLIAMRMRVLNSEKSSDLSDLMNVSITSTGELPKPIFRNYKPISEDLKQGELPQTQMVNLDDHIKKYMEAGRSESLVEEVNLVNLAPRKPDWDLKRGLEKKLKKLEKRTQRAITELIRERLSEQKDNLVEV